MADKNLNDFFDDEFNKQQEERRQAEERQKASAAEEEKRRSMYYGIPEYSGQQQFVSRRSKGKTALIVTLCAVALVVVFFMGYFTFLLANPDLKFINDVLNLVNEQAYIWDESDDKYERDYAYQAAKAILSSIDQYSTLLTPEEFYTLMYGESTPVGASNGVSYTVDADGEYVVYEVGIGSPGYKAGLFTGDIVRKMTVYGNSEGIADGTALEVTPKTDLETFKKYIHSQRIDFVLLRGDETVSINGVVASSSYDSATIEYYFGASATNMSGAYKERINAESMPSDVGYIRLTTFMYDESVAEMESAMALFKSSGKTKLIFDLCGNGGGKSDVAAKIASYLVWDDGNASGDGIVVSVNKDKNDKEVSRQTTDSVYDDYFDVNSSSPQIVVLADSGSASASEMLLGAVTDYKTAVHVGTKTYGKGIAQGVIPLKAAQANINGEIVDSYWAAYMTYVKFFTPVSDVCHHGTGFEPEPENVAETYDGMIQRALEILG